MTSPFSNLWFSAFTTVVMALACYTNFQNLAENWGVLVYLAILLLNTICLGMSRLAAKEASHDQPR